MAHFVDGFGNQADGYPLLNLDHVVTMRPRMIASAKLLPIDAADDDPAA